MEQFPKVAASSSYAEEIIPNQRLKIDIEGFTSLVTNFKICVLNSFIASSSSIRPSLCCHNCDILPFIHYMMDQTDNIRFLQVKMHFQTVSGV